MMNVLDALRYRLGGMTDTEGEQIDPGILEALGMRSGRLLPQQPLPAGLPLVVQDAIRNQPSYQEGGQYMATPWYNPGMAAEEHLYEQPQRNAPLEQGIDDVRNMNRTDLDIAEGWGLTSRPVGQSPYASPLNQLMQQGRRLPFSLY